MAKFISVLKQTGMDFLYLLEIIFGLLLPAFIFVLLVIALVFGIGYVFLLNWIVGLLVFIFVILVLLFYKNWTNSNL